MRIRGQAHHRRGKALGTRQIIQEWIAESRAEIHASRLMVLHAAWKIDTQGAYAAREEISLIKFYVANMMMKVIDRAIQVHGGLGVSDDTILSLLLPDGARVAHLRRRGRGAQVRGGQAHIAQIYERREIGRKVAQ